MITNALVGLLLLPGCLLDWDRDGLTKGNDCSDLDGVDSRESWYRDADRDGYGDPNSEILSCLWPIGWVENGLDCDDEKPKLNPGAEDEWYDAEDSNCDEMNDFDRDRDGYVHEDYWQYQGGSAPYINDCDDNDPNVFPDAVEVYYDGRDQDCDGKSDFDLDGDGHDSALYSGPDCDDYNANISPSRPEDCDDGIDTDCDGFLGTLAYLDEDGDGYGDPDVFIEACTPPEGYAAQTGDCDLSDGDISPGAIEVCGDGIDNNCDGEERICGPFGEGRLDEADARIGSDVAQTQIGVNLTCPGDLDGDGADDLLLGSNDNVAWLVSGAGSGDIQSLAYATFTNSAAPGRSFGRAVSGAGDVDGDGLADIAIGAYQRSGDPEVWILGGPFSGDIEVSSAPEVLATIDCIDASSQFEVSLGSGEYTGDALSDVVIGVPARDVGIESFVYLVPGGSTGTINCDALPDVITTSAEAEMGFAVVADQDLDGDGLHDLVIGSPERGAGTVDIFRGPISGVYDLEDADTSYYDSGASSSRIGEAIAVPGDLNSDGYYNLVIGAPSYSSSRGRVYVIGDPTGGGYDVDSFNRIDGEDAYDRFGASLSGAGDLDGDGQEDLIIGAPGVDDLETDTGAIYIFSGPVEGYLSFTSAVGYFQGADRLDLAGTSVLGGVDLNGDGRPDIASGSPDAAAPTAASGELYLFFGAP